MLFHMRQCETFTLPQARSTVWRLGVSSTLDVSKQSERLAKGAVDFNVRMEFSTNYLRLRKPMPSLSMIEAMDQR